MREAIRQNGIAQRRHSTRRKLSISRAGLTGALLAIAFGCVGGVMSPSHWLVVGCGVSLAIILLLLWQENEPPLLLFPALYQWLSVSIKPIMSVVEKVPVNVLSEFDKDIVPGITLGLFGVTALAVGMRLGLGRAAQDWNATLRNEAGSLTQSSTMRVAILGILLGHLMFFLMRFAGPASQVFYAVANIRFAGLFALAYWCFINGRGFIYLFVAVAIEFAIGVTGFFSDFKAPILVIIFAAVAAGHRPRVRDSIFVATMGAVLILFGSFWSYVKVDYRMYISGGTGSQVIVVPLEDRLDYLGNEIVNFDRVRFADGFDKMLRRQSYIDFLSATMDYVPAVIPHENGQRIGKVLMHVITPRIFFPNKPPLEFDTEVTLHYTGLPIQIREGTSISIGYLGELYIDFGSVGAAACCLLLGLAFGRGYALLRARGRGSLLLTYGARSTVLAVMLPFDLALIKYIGGAGIAFVGAYLIQIMLVPWLSSRLRVNPQPAPAPRQRALSGAA